MRGYLNRVRREINRGKSLRVKPRPLRAIEGRTPAKWKAFIPYAMLNLVSEKLPHKGKSPMNHATQKD
jgi:hypothetical protein